MMRASKDRKRHSARVRARRWRQQLAFSATEVRGAEESDQSGQSSIGKANLISHYGADV